MEKEKIIDQVLITVRGVISVNNELDYNQNLMEIGLDSLKTMQLIVELENRFYFTFEDEELLLNNFSTVKKIVEIIEKKLVSTTISN